MPKPPGSRRHGRQWPALLAGSTAVVVAALGGAMSVATSSLPGRWTTHHAAIVWGIVGGLLVLTVILAVLGARLTTGPVLTAPTRSTHDKDRQVLVGQITARPVAFMEPHALAELTDAWDAGVRVAVVQAIMGGPGVGKTQAAAADARDRAAEGWPLVAWIPAESRDQLFVGFSAVAIAVGIADTEGDSAASVENVRRYLETFQIGR